MPRILIAMAVILAAACSAGCTHQWFRQHPTPNNLAADVLEGAASTAVVVPYAVAYVPGQVLATVGDALPCLPGREKLEEGAAVLALPLYVAIVPLTLAFSLAEALHTEPPAGRGRLRHEGGWSGPVWDETPAEARHRAGLQGY